MDYLFQYCIVYTVDWNNPGPSRNAEIFDGTETISKWTDEEQESEVQLPNKNLDSPEDDSPTVEKNDLTPWTQADGIVEDPWKNTPANMSSPDEKWANFDTNFSFETVETKDGIPVPEEKQAEAV